MSSSARPSQFQQDDIRTPEAPPSKAAACPKYTRIKLKKKSGHIADPRMKERTKVAKRAVSEAAAILGIGKKHKRVCMSDYVLDGCCRNVDERT